MMISFALPMLWWLLKQRIGVQKQLNITINVKMVDGLTMWIFVVCTPG
uniref:ATP synthase F0 subunit 8 n=1 Tax=Romanomermis culicivorax TaxID=13658 RepID=A0A915JHZ8_ROMCU